MEEEREDLFERKPPSIWRRIYWKLDKAYWWVRSLPHNIYRVLTWFPIIWKDRDFDFAFFLTLMQYKMKRMREHIVQHDHLVSSKRIGKQLKYAEFLIDEYFDSKVRDKMLEDHEAEWGEIKTDLVKDKKLDGVEERYAQLWRMDSYTKKARAEGREDEEHEARTAMYRRQTEHEQEMLDRLFRHMRKYIQHWWD